MRRLAFVITFTVFYVFLSGYARAVVTHAENTDIVGLVDPSNRVCFNNDGALASNSECDQSVFDEGSVYLDFGGWLGAFTSGINGCGNYSVNPVSIATCPFVNGVIHGCSGDDWILVQTTKSGHFWAVKANESCTGIASPESTGLVPCLSSDAFNRDDGCFPGNPPEIAVEGGYIKLNTHNGSPPPVGHCDDITHDGRMVVDSVNGLIYICTQSGWIAK